MRVGGVRALAGPRSGKKSKRTLRQACSAHLLELLEPRLLLSTNTNYVCDTSTNATLTGNSLVYVDATSHAQDTVTILSGDTVTGGGGTGTELFVSESAANTSVSPTQVSFGASTLNYSTITHLDVTAAAILSVSGTGAADAFTASSSQVTFPSRTIDYSGVTSLSLNGSAGSDTLAVNDSNAAHAIGVSGSSVTLADFSIAYTSFTAVTVNSGGGADTFTVTSTASGTPVTVNSNSSSPASTTVGSSGQLSSIAATLTVNNGNLTVDDTGVSTGQTGSLSDTALTGLDLPASVPINYSSIGTLSVNLGSHGNTFTVSNTASNTTTNIRPGSGSSNSVGIQATAATGPLNVSYLASGGSTAIVVGSAAPSVGGVLSGIAGAVTITGHSGDSLDLYDSNDGTTGLSVTVTGSAVTGLGMGSSGVSYSGVGSLGVHTGLVAAAINVQSTHSGIPTTISTGGGANTIIVGSTAPTLGGNTSGLSGALTISGDNSDVLTVDDSGGSGHSTGGLNSSTISNLAPVSIGYSGITTLTVKLGDGSPTPDGLTISATNSSTTTNVTTPAGNDTVNVQAISSATTITTGGTNNTINVTSAAPHNIDGIGALLTVNGASGDALVVDDSGSSALRSPTLSSSSITIGPAIIHYSGVSKVTLNLGSASDTVNVTGTASVASSTIAGGSGTDTYTISNDSGPLVLNTGGGNDAVNIKATGAATTINAGTGQDPIVVGSNAPGSGGVLNNITGALTINGNSGGSTSLTLDDTGAATAKTVTIGSGSSTVGLSAAIGYSNLANFTVNLGSHGNTVTLSGTPASTVLNSGSGNDTVTVSGAGNVTTVNGGSGNDTINVQQIGAAMTVNAGLGNDTVNVGNSGTLTNISAALTVSGDSSDTLNVNDGSDISAHGAAVLSNTSVTGLGNSGTINYSGVGAVTVNLGSGANTLQVASTSGSATTTVNSKSGSDHISINSTGGATAVNDTKSTVSSDAFIVSSSAPTAGGIVNGIQGALTITGTASGNDSLTVDDSGSSSAKTGSVSATAITGLGMGSSGIAYSNIKSLTLKLGGVGSTGDNFTVAGTSSFGSTTVNAGSGNDTINVQAIGGATTVNAGAGNNTVNVGSTAPLSGGVVSGIAATLTVAGNPSKDVLNIDDSGDSSPGTVSHTSSNVTIGSAVINYSGFSKVHVDLGAGGSFDIKPSSNAVTYTASTTVPGTVTVDVHNQTVTMGSVPQSYAGDSNVTLIGQTFGDGNDPLIINGSTSDETFTLSANTVSFGTTTIGYSAFASLSIFGGFGKDSFIVNGDSAPTTITDGTSATHGSSNPVSFTVNSNNQMLTLVGGTGSATTFNVTGNAAALTINGTGGTNIFNVSGDSGNTSISGGSGTNTFNISGNSAQLGLTGNGTANSFNITGNSASINATGGATSTDSFVVSKTTAPITLQAGNGTTTFHITAPTQASVTVAGGSAGTASLIFDGNPTADVFTITGGAIQGVGATLNYSALKNITVNGTGGADTFWVQGDSTPTTLNGASAPDIFNVNSFSSHVTINTITSSTINLGNNQPNSPSVLSSLNGTVTVTGAGADQLNIDDSGDANPQTVGLSATVFTLSPTTVNYSHIGTLNVTLGGGGNTVGVTGTAAGTITNLNTGTGNDNVNIQAVGGTTNVNTGGGNSNPIVVGSTAPTLGGNLSSINAPLNLTGSGTDSLTLDDSGGSLGRTATISSSSVAITGLGTIGYSGMSSLSVKFGSGGNNITLASTNAATQTNITNAGSGSNTITVAGDSSQTNIDTGKGTSNVYVRSTGAATMITTGAGGTSNFIVGSFAPAGNGILDGIQGALTLAGGGSGSLTLDDTGSSIAKNGQIDAAAINGLGMGASGIAYSGIATLAVNLGSGGDNLTITNTSAATTVNAGSGNDTLTLQNDSNPTTINTGNGNDIVNIQKTGATTGVNTGTGADTVNIGSNAPGGNGVLANINGAVTVTGGGNTALNIDDTGNINPASGTLSSSSLTGFSPAPINYSNLASLSLSLGSGGNALTIASTPAPTTVNSGSGNDTVTLVSTVSPTTINTQGGNDNVYIRSTNAATTVNTGSGADTIMVGSLAPAGGGILDNIQGALTINGDGHDNLAFDDTGSNAAKTGTLTSSTLSGLGMAGATYNGIATLTINLGQGGDILTIASTNGATTTNVNAGTGNDTLYVNSTSGPTNVTTGSGTDFVVVGSTDPNPGAVLDNIQGALSITGAGAATTLSLDDTGSTLAKTGTLTATTITGLAMGPSGVTYHAIGTVNVDLGSGANNFTIGATNSSTTTNVNGGSAPETFYVQSTSGPTNVNTGAGTNTVNVGSNDALGTSEPVATSILDLIQGALTVTGNGTDTLNLDDQGSAGHKTGTLTASTVTGLAMGSSGITYNSIATLNTYLGSGGNIFTILSTFASPSVSTTTNLNSGSGNDTVTIQSDSGPTNVNTGAGNDTVNVVATGGPTNINTGGSGTDTINVGSNAPPLPSGGNSNGIQGALTVVGDGNDTVNVDDTAAGALAAPVTLSATNLFIPGMTLAGITYGGLANLNVFLGSGGDTVNVTGTSATSGTTITTLSGNSTFNVVPSASGALTLAGPLNLNPGVGTNSLTVNDSSDPAARSLIVTGTSIAGLGGPIDYLNFTNLTIDLGTASGNSVTVTGGALPVNTTIQNGSTTGGNATVTYGTSANPVNFTGNLTLINFANGSMLVTGNFLGNLTATAISYIEIDGTVDSGTMNLGSVGSIYAPNLTSSGGLVFQVTQAGVLRQIQAGVPNNPVSQAAPQGGVIFSYYSPFTTTPVPTFAIAYDGSTLSTAPQAAIRVTNPSAASMDLALTSSSTAAKFDLSRLDTASGTSHSGIQSVSVDGDLLNAVTSLELTNPITGISRPAMASLGASDTGVFLPNDTLVGVAVRDNAALNSVAATGLMAGAFASLGGTPVASLSSSTFRAGLFKINPATNSPYLKTVLVSGRLRVPIGQAPVGVFTDGEPDGDGDFDASQLTLTNQGTGNAPVTAFATFLNTQPTKNSISYVQITNLNFVGDGGSVKTSLPVLNITSTGPLGDLTLSSSTAVNNVTVPAVQGNVSITGGIAGTFQTTGNRIDPVTGATSGVSADIGKVLTSGSPPAVTGVTTFAANILSGAKLVSRGNLISQLTASSSIAGTVAAAGNIGFAVANGTKLTRFGGISTATLASGADIFALGNIFGDIKISSSTAGRIAAEGLGTVLTGVTGELGILGNVTTGTFASTGAIVSGGLIGDVNQGTSILISSFSGILAAQGAIKFNSSSKTNTTRTFASATGNNLTAIKNIWAAASAFDDPGTLDLVGLNALLSKLNSLKVTTTNPPSLTGT